MLSGPGIQKKTLHSGRGPHSEYPNETKFVFHYQIRQVNDEHTVLDDTRKYGKPMELFSGKKFALEFWEVCLGTMCVEEVASFTISKDLLLNFPATNKKLRDYFLKKHAHGTAHHTCAMMSMAEQGGLGYKDLDKLQEKPEPLEFIFELLTVQRPGDENHKKDVWLMSPEEKEVEIPKLREIGNVLYTSGDLPQAAMKYSEALGMLEDLLLREKPGEPEWIDIENQKVPFLLNLAQCRLLLKEYYPCIDHCTEVLKKNPDNVKALFRRGRAHASVWNVQSAQDDLQKAAELDPKLANQVKKELETLLIKCKQKEKEESDALRGRLFKSGQ